jgi:anthranilate synthase component 1
MSFARTWIADWVTPFSAYVKLRRAAQKETGARAASFLLESVTGGERWGRYTILGYRPKRQAVLGRDAIWRVDGEEIPARGRDALAVADEALGLDRNAKRSDPAERHRKAHVGFFSWDLTHEIEKVTRWSDADAAYKSDIPLARFVGDATTVVFDNFLQTMTISAASEDEVDRAFEEIRAPLPLSWLEGETTKRLPPNVRENMTDAEFEAIVLRAKEYIAAGDAFQIVLARKFTISSEGIDPLSAYRAMRILNPSPYMFFLDFPESNDSGVKTSAMQILGASPETLVRLEGDKMTVRPLAGTRRRGKTPDEDRALEAELLADPKERAEHVMLIDLGRNDVGRVAKIGGVHLLRQMQIERYSHVMHIVSEVEGEIDRANVPALDVFRSAFPAGTLSGAPKLRAMQIIRELERGPRGIYGGAVGYVSESGDFDLAIAIRSAVCRNGFFEVTAGAGIVEGSDPAAEAAETRAKAASVLTSIGAAQKLF